MDPREIQWAEEGKLHKLPKEMRYEPFEFETDQEHLANLYMNGLIL